MRESVEEEVDSMIKCKAEVETVENLVRIAMRRMREGLPPPPEIYLVQNRGKIDWSRCPNWARPVEPDVFDGCCHEG